MEETLHAKEGTVNKKKRVEWLDTLKFIGIYTIFIAHFLDGAGYLYKFACMYVIQLFFFVSGCFAEKAVKQQSLPAYIKKQVKHLLIPYAAFSLINIVLIVIQENRSIPDILPLIKQMFFGIRNQLFAPALWFLPCLFVVSIAYAILLKVGKKRSIALITSILIYGLAANFLPFDATETPLWFFNADSALFYLLFYALGASTFEVLKKLSKEKTVSFWKSLDKMKQVIMVAAVILGGILVLLPTILTFFGRLDYFYIYPVFAKVPLLTWLYPIYIAGSIIIVNIGIAMWLQRIPLLSLLGKNTLAFCGNETIIKTLMVCLLSLFGWNLQIASPLHAYIYAFILLILCNYVMIPIEKKLFPKGII